MVTIDKSASQASSGDGRTGFAFTAALAAFYAGFVLLGAFSPEVLARPIWIGAGLTLAFAYGFAVMVLGIVLTGVYVIRANLREAQADYVTAAVRFETAR